MGNYLNKAVTISGKDYLMSTEDIAFSRRWIYITGEITDALAQSVCSALRILASESEEPVTLFIQGPGGSVSAGLSIYDTCQAVKCDIITVACGMAASMSAFLVCCAGTKGMRYMQKNAELMIHQPLAGTQGQASDIRIHAEHVLKIKDRLNAMFAEATGQTIGQIEEDTERDHFMDAPEALAYGLVDVIGEPDME